MEEAGIKEQERVALIEDLSRKISEAVVFDRTSPEYAAKMLALMDDLEKAREILKQFNVTVGEGEDRAVVFTNFRDIQRVSQIILDTEPDTDYDPVKTTYRERLVINRAGVYVLASVQKQSFDYDPDQRLPESRVKWSNYSSVLAQHYGGEAEELLSSVLAAGKYPEITITPLVSGSGKGWTAEQDREWHRQMDAWWLGEGKLSPKWSGSGFRSLTDTQFEQRPLRGWYTGGFEEYRVTKPKLVGSMMKAISQRSSTPAPSIPVAA